MNKLNIVLLKLLSTVGVGYFNQKLYTLKVNNAGELSWHESSGETVPRCLIVAREHYQEEQVAYPVESKKEVKNLVLLDQVEQDRALISSFVIYPSENGKTSVNQWVFDHSVPKAMCIIPESYLLTSGCEPYQAITSYHGQRRSYFTKTPTGVVSSVQGGLIADINSFAMASGVVLSNTLPPVEVTAKEHADVIGAQILPFLLKEAHHFIYKDSSQNSGLEKNSVPILLSSLLASAMYLGVSSGYLLWQEQKFDQAVENNRSSVNQAISVQNDFTRLTKELKQQREFIATQSLKTPFWEVVAPLFKQAKFRTLRYRNGRFVINGETNRATDLLDILNDSPLVTDAKFDTGVRKSRKKEVFIISFVLVQPSSSLE